MDSSSTVSGKLAHYMGKTKMRSIPCSINNNKKKKLFGSEK